MKIVFWCYIVVAFNLMMLVASASDVYINEFVAKNSSSLLNEYDEAEDWIELYNDSSQAVDLSGWHLTDSVSDKTKWSFPSVSIPSRGYLIVWASSRDTVINDEIHANFKLDGDGEYLALVRPDGITVEHEYAPNFPGQKTDISYGMYFSGNGSQVTLLSSQSDCRYHIPTGDIGTDWHAASFDDSAWASGLTGVGYERSSGYDDYINTDVEALMYLAMGSAYIRIPFNVDDPAELDDFTLSMRYEDGIAVWLNGVLIVEDNLPSGVTGDTIPWNEEADTTRSDSLAVVMTEIFSSGNPQDYLVAGENVLAIHGINKGTGSSDFLMQPQITANLLSEYKLEGERYFATPTPGEVNSGEAMDFVGDTSFSVDRGFYTDSFPLVISCDTDGVEIRYTLDGSTPTAVSGFVYDDPIIISRTTVVRAAAFLDGWQPSDVDTQTYIFPADVVQQPEQPDGWPTSWTGGYKDYEMDPDVVNSADYSNEFPEVLTRIPTVSIVTDQDNLFGSSGIYDNSTQEGVAWERPASVEMINPDGSKGFQVNCGLRMQGGASRTASNSPKHSFRLLFKDIYGPTKLNYKLFDDSEIDEFDTVVLRAGYNNTWIHWGEDQRPRAQYARDLFARRVQLAMGQPAAHGNMVHLYINGLYWGLYNPSERPTADFASSYMGGSKDEWDTTNSGEIIDGDLTAWNTMMSMANAGLTDLASYQAFMQYCDVVNLADYMIVNHYIGNTDWDWHNWYAGRRRREGEGYKFFCWDSEHSIKTTTANVTSCNNDNNPTRLFHQARLNPEFKLMFADRLHKHLFNDGPLSAVNALSIWNGISDINNGVVVAESARWADYRGAYTVNDHYLPHQDWIINTYFPGRTATVLSQYSSLGLYPTLAAPEFDVYGSIFSGSTSVTITAPAAIYYTLDGSDPREFGTGSIHGTLCTGSVSMEHTARLKARCFDGETWSALTEADFYDMSPSMLKITEIMSSPRIPDSSEAVVSGDASDYSYIEFYNSGSDTLGLVGFEITDGIQFDFSFCSNLILEAGEYVVVVKDREAFAVRYPDQVGKVAGEFFGNLSGDGESIRVEALAVGVVLSFAYNDARDWPLAADGAGHSLVPVDAETLSNRLLNYGGNWRASWSVDGSPGAADSADPDDKLCLNEIAAHTDLDDPSYPDYDSNDWIELYNSGDSTISLNGYYLSDDPADLTKWSLPSALLLEPGAFITFDEITGFHSPYPDGFGIDKAGEQIFLSYAPQVSVLRVVDAIRFKGQENGATLGRFPNGEGCWCACLPTRDAVNQPQSDQPMISEVMYNATGDDDVFEYIEICNPASYTAPLWTMDGAELVGSWRISGDVDYTFPAYTELPAVGRILLVPFDPLDSVLKTAFLNHYNLSTSVILYGPYDGKLSNEGGRITLEKPQAPDVVDEDVLWVIVDELFFYDDQPWTLPPDGMGYALHRALPGFPAADPASWLDGFPSPGDSAVRRPDLRINSFGVGVENYLLGFDLLSGVEYTLESTTNLSEGVWLPRATLMNQPEYVAPIESEPKSEYFRLSR